MIMIKSQFAFIQNNEILRNNLNQVFDHILVLLPFTESKTYDSVAKSSFRKTIIIHTASIIEALLFYMLDNKFSDKDITKFYSHWKLKNEHILYTISKSHKIICGNYEKIPGNIKKKTKMNLGQIVNFLKENKLLDEKLFAKVSSVRKLRNDQHIGAHQNVKTYSSKDLEDSFSVAREIKNFIIQEMKRSVIKKSLR